MASTHAVGGLDSMQHWRAGCDGKVMVITTDRTMLEIEGLVAVEVDLGSA